MKKWLPLFAIIFLTSCVGNKPVEKQTQEETANVSQSESTQNESSPKENKENNETDLGGITSLIFEEIQKEGLIGQTIQVSENNILNRYGIDTADLEDYIFEEPATSENADTLVILKCKESEKAEEIKEILSIQLENVKATTESYAPDQFALYNKSILETNGSYVYWIVSEKNSEIKTLIEKMTNL